MNVNIINFNIFPNIEPSYILRILNHAWNLLILLLWLFFPLDIDIYTQNEDLFSVFICQNSMLGFDSLCVCRISRGNPKTHSILLKCKILY